jgi:hypothetical protein
MRTTLGDHHGQFNEDDKRELEALCLCVLPLRPVPLRRRVRLLLLQGLRLRQRRLGNEADGRLIARGSPGRLGGLTRSSTPDRA